MRKEIAIHNLYALKQRTRALSNHEALDMAIKALEQTRWIPVSERLPEDGTWNIFTDGKAISVERYKSDAIDHFYPDGRWFSLEEAVAWMPLPELCKAESEG